MKAALMILVIVIVVAIALGGYYAVQDMKYSSSGASSTIVYTTTSTVPSGNHSTSTVQQSTGNSSYTVNILYNSTVGYHLANSTGEALYYYKVDSVGSNTSACNGGCSGTWVPFYTATLNLPAGLSTSDFHTITRGDGSKQLTYKGSPLYHFIGDNKFGQVNGQGTGGVWYTYSVSAPGTTQTQSNSTTATTTKASTTALASTSAASTVATTATTTAMATTVVSTWG